MNVARAWLFVLPILCSIGCAYAQPRDIAVPADVGVTAPSPDVPKELAPFSGRWSGSWYGAETNTHMADQIIVVESLSAPASARVAYAGIGRWQSLYGRQWFFRVDATLVEDSLQFRLPNGTLVSCRMNPDGTMGATGTTGQGTWRGTFKRISS
jgi:hypothetical protein